MESIDQDFRPKRNDQAMKLILAVARGDATAQDVAAQLRTQEVDALEVVLALLARASAAPRERIRARRHINIQRFLQPTPPDLVAKTAHQVPHRPFLMNGTLYDPLDIHRFDGRELHLIATAADEPILAVDDRETFGRWLASTYVSYAALSPSSPVIDDRYRYGGYQFGPGPRDAPVVVVTPPPPTQGTGGGLPWPQGEEKVTSFYEDIQFQGAVLHLDANFAYHDLTHLSRGFLGTSDWNDFISSVHMYGNWVCTLYEHVDFQGSSFTMLKRGAYGQAVPYLSTYGWNDRASSVETW